MGYVKVKDRREIEESWKGMKKLDWKRVEKEKLELEKIEVEKKIEISEKDLEEWREMEKRDYDEKFREVRKWRNKRNRIEIKIDGISDELDWKEMVGDLLFVKSKNGLGFFRGSSRGRISKEKVVVIIEEKKDNKKRMMVMCDEGIVSVGKEEIMRCCLLINKNSELEDEGVCDEDG